MYYRVATREHIVLSLHVAELTDDDMSGPHRRLIGTAMVVCVHRAPMLAGNYSRLALEIQFERSMGYYLIQMYVPSSLIVIISWVSEYPPYQRKIAETTSHIC